MRSHRGEGNFWHTGAFIAVPVGLLCCWKDVMNSLIKNSHSFRVRNPIAQLFFLNKRCQYLLRYNHIVTITMIIALSV